MLVSLPLSAVGRDVIHHDLTVSIDPEARTVHVFDRITLPKFSPGQTPVFTLGKAFELAQASPGLAELETSSDRTPAHGVRRYRLAGSQATLQVSYGLAQSALSHLGMGRESTHPIYLDNADAWLLHPPGMPLTARLTVNLPNGWLAVSQGEPLGPNQWQIDQPHWGLHLIVDRYHRTELDDGRRPRVLTFFRRLDAPLARRYLDKGRHYLGWFERLLGPYPYPAFSVIENRWESGLGMPSFTLLGPRVLRLPFILDSAYPHEILHNWWGNGVYPDPKGGNWSEGLTAYLADHLVQEMAGKGAGYRRRALQKYFNYVEAADDFPLHAFRGGHEPKTQAIGYGKGLMVFHMLRSRLGNQAFLRGLRTIISRHMFQTASYGDLRAAFEHAAGEPLRQFFEQWVARPGAPQLALRAERDTNDPYVLQIHVYQTQLAPAFSLQLPVAVDLENGAVEMHRLKMSTREHRKTLRFPAPPLGIRLDPGFDVFRRLSREEVPASLGELFGGKHAVLVLPDVQAQDETTHYARMAKQWAKRFGWRIVSDNGFTWPAQGKVIVLGADNRHLDSVLRLLHPHVQLGGAGANDIRLGGQNLDPTQSFAAAGRRGDLTVAWVVLGYPETAEPLARRLPHYGRYGYAVFTGRLAKATSRGEWRVTASPLAQWLDSGDARFRSLPARNKLLKLSD